MWATVGLTLSVSISLLAFVYSKQAPSNYYQREVYGMTGRTHRGYALAGLLFVLLFALCLGLPSLPVIPVFGAFVLLAIFYATSFARGFSDAE